MLGGLHYSRRYRLHYTMVPGILFSTYSRLYVEPTIVAEKSQGVQDSIALLSDDPHHFGTGYVTASGLSGN